MRASVVVMLGLSGCGSWALERRLRSCGARAWLLRGMWDLPGSGIEPVSPALAGGFLTTMPPGKSLQYILKIYTYYIERSNLNNYFIILRCILYLNYAVVWMDI